MPSPTNQTALTAMVIPSLPFSVTQDVSAESSSLQLWYTYTATATDRVVGVVPYADISSGYTPRLTIYTGPASAPVGYHVTNSLQRSAYVPVTEGTVYLWKVTQGGGTTPLGTSLTFKAVSGALNTAPANSILSTEENTGFPAPVVSGTTDNTIYFYTDFAIAAIGDTLDDGTILCDDSGDILKLYNAALTEIWSGLPYYDYTPTISSNTSTKFYLLYEKGSGNPRELRTLMPDGSLTTDLWTLPANSEHALGFAPSRDGTILYYGQSSGTGSGTIHRYDLVNRVALTDLAGAVASHSSGKILLLADGSILVRYQQGATDFLLKRYDTSGTVLSTYNFGTVQIHNTMLAYDTPTTFWVWLEDNLLTPTTSTYRRILIADGSTVNDADYNLFAAGPSALSYDPTYSDVDDVPLFGMAPTCTCFVLRESTSPTAPPSPPFPPGTVVGPAAPGIDDPIRRLRQAPHLAATESGHRLKYPGFQLDVESGAQRDEDVPLTFFLQWSDDGGHTWSNLHELTGSSLGQYKYRFWWRRLGQSRDRVFRTIENNNAKSVIVDARLVPDPVEGSS